MKGWYCRNFLWWHVHEPDAEELVAGPVVEDRLEQGRQVGELARESIPDGVLIDLPHNAYRDRIAATRAQLEAGAPAIFEASFSADDVFVAVDILEREGSAHHVIEVKSSTRVKAEHLPDVAIQTHVVGASGVEVGRSEVMHLNPAYRHPGRGPLFVREDVTRQVLELLPGVPEQIAAQKSVLGGEFPDIPLGVQCASVSNCSFRGRCWPDEEDHILTLYGKGLRKALELMEEGIQTIHDLPDDMQFGAVAERQRRAVEGQSLVVDPDPLPQAAKQPHQIVTQ